MISFGAKYISPATVQKIDNKNDKKEACKVAFVELDPYDTEDMRVVSKVAKTWRTPEELDKLIYKNMRNFAEYGNTGRHKGNKFYAITTQNENYDSLEYSDVLALSQVNTNGRIRISALQTKPENNEYNRVGTAMLNSIKKLFSGEKISLFSFPKDKEFYLKNGFVQSKDCKVDMYYEA